MADQDGRDQGETRWWVPYHFPSTYFIIYSPATVQAPKFVREIKEIRIKEGMRGKFEAGFAGNPKPEITWWFNGQQMQNSKNVQIKLREDSSTLTLIDCSFDMAGIYECRAVNDQGNDKCRASLSVNSKSIHVCLQTVFNHCNVQSWPLKKRPNMKRPSQRAF